MKLTWFSQNQIHLSHLLEKVNDEFYFQTKIAKLLMQLCQDCKIYHDIHLFLASMLYWCVNIYEVSSLYLVWVIETSLVVITICLSPLECFNLQVVNGFQAGQHTMHTYLCLCVCLWKWLQHNCFQLLPSTNVCHISSELFLLCVFSYINTLWMDMNLWPLLSHVLFSFYFSYL